jgi:hypothetical protein
MMVVSGQNYVNKPQYRTQNLKNELWGPKNVNKLGSFGNTGKGLSLLLYPQNEDIEKRVEKSKN